MANIGVLTPGIAGHLNPFSCLGRALQLKGHTVMAFQIPYFEEAVRRSGLDYHPIGEDVFPRSRTEEIYACMGKLRDRKLLRYSISIFMERSQMFLAEAPDALSRVGIELLLVDQVEPAGASVAERLGIPFVTVSNALVTNGRAGHSTALHSLALLAQPPRQAPKPIGLSPFGQTNPAMVVID